MKPTPFAAGVALLAALAGLASATIIKPNYAPGLSAPDSVGMATPVRMINNSGMTPPVFTGTPVADAAASSHVFNMAAGASWLTNDPAPPGGDYFAEAAAEPVIVFDIGANRNITELYFWQFQGTGAALGNWAKDIEVRFATGPGPPSFPGPEDMIVTLAAPPPAGANLPQVFDVPMPAGAGITARFIQLRFKSNHIAHPSPGGERVGLGEFRVDVDDEPDVTLTPALTDVSGDLIPRDYTVTLSNLSGQNSIDVDVQGIQITGPNAAEFSILSPLSPPLTLTVGASATLDVVVRFTPIGPGPYSAFLTVPVTGGAPGATVTMAAFTGVFTPTLTDPQIVIGAEIPPVISTVQLGPYPDGIGSQEFTVMVTNAGDGMTGPDLMVSDLILTGADAMDGHFLKESSPSLPVTLASAESETFLFQFDPGEEAPRMFTTSVQIMSNDPTYATLDVPVEAEILSDLEITTPPPVTLNPLSTGSDTIPIELSNSGLGYSLSGVEVVSADGGPFTEGAYTTGTIGATETIGIDYSHDGVPGEFTVRVGIEYDISGGLPIYFEVEFSVSVAPAILRVNEYFLHDEGVSDDDELSLEVRNVPTYDGLHLRYRDSGTGDFEIFSPPIDISADTADLRVPVDFSRDPDQFLLQLYDGPSVP